MKCGKCGCKLTNKTAIDWDVSGSTHRYICSECAEEEGIDLKDEPAPLPPPPPKQKPKAKQKTKQKIKNVYPCLRCGSPLYAVLGMPYRYNCLTCGSTFIIE